MNKYQSDVVADAIGELKRASQKLAMVATQLVSEATELDGAPRAEKANKAIEIYTLSGSVLVHLDRYETPITLIARKA